MRRVLQVIVALCLLAPRLAGAETPVSLGWADPAPMGAEAVIVLRSASGATALTLRAGLDAGAQAKTLTLPSIPRAATTLQAGVVADGGVLLQGPVLPLPDALRRDTVLTLTEALAVGFSDLWDCGEAWPIRVITGPEGVAVTPGSGTFHVSGNQARYLHADGTERDCAATLSAPIYPLSVRATDGQWTLDLTAERALLDLQEIDRAALEREGFIVAAPRDGTITLRNAQLSLHLVEDLCRLDHSPLAYPVRATLTGPAPDDARPACGGDPLALLGGGAWRVTTLLGQGLDRTREQGLTLELSGDRIAGRGTCNLYVGTALVKDGRLAFREFGTTTLACAADRRNLELRFLDALEAVTGFDLSPSGRLTLHAGPQAVISATRSDAK